MSESRSTNPWKPWQRLLDPIGPDYRRQLLKARNRATRAIDDLYKDELARAARAWSARSLRVDASGTVPAGVDGEAVTLAPPLGFTIHPKALRVRIAPRQVRQHASSARTADLNREGSSGRGSEPTGLPRTRPRSLVVPRSSGTRARVFGQFVGPPRKGRAERNASKPTAA